MARDAAHSAPVAPVAGGQGSISLSQTRRPHAAAIDARNSSAEDSPSTYRSAVAAMARTRAEHGGRLRRRQAQTNSHNLRALALPLPRAKSSRTRGSSQ